MGTKIGPMNKDTVKGKDFLWKEPVGKFLTTINISYQFSRDLLFRLDESFSKFWEIDQLHSMVSAEGTNLGYFLTPFHKRETEDSTDSYI